MVSTLLLVTLLVGGVALGNASTSSTHPSPHGEHRATRRVPPVVSDPNDNGGEDGSDRRDAWAQAAARRLAVASVTRIPPGPGGFGASHSASRRRSDSSSRGLSEEGSGSQSCPGDPMMWTVHRARGGAGGGDGDVVGFAVGTMHRPRDIVLTVDAWKVISRAVSSSCVVYGEVDLLDGAVAEAVTACLNQYVNDPERYILISDVPDGSLRFELMKKTEEIAAAAFPDDVSKALEFYGVLEAVHIGSLMGMITQFNAPETREMLLNLLRGVPQTATMDQDIFGLAQQTGGLENVQAQCDVIEVLFPTKDEFLAGFDERYAADMREDLKASVSEEIKNYRCGDASVFAESYDVTLEDSLSKEDVDVILDGELLLF